MKVSSKDDPKQEVFELNGVVAVINTPFTNEDQIDYESIARYVENAIESGASGFLVPAMAAEVNKLTPVERKSIVKTVVICMSPEAPLSIAFST